MYFYKNYARKHVVFWKNLHSWQKFYTTAGRDGRDKSQLWFRCALAANLYISTFARLFLGCSLKIFFGPARVEIYQKKLGLAGTLFCWI